jgi:hypothetical protein
LSIGLGWEALGRLDGLGVEGPGRVEILRRERDTRACLHWWGSTLLVVRQSGLQDVAALGADQADRRQETWACLTSTRPLSTNGNGASRCCADVVKRCCAHTRPLAGLAMQQMTARQAPLAARKLTGQVGVKPRAVLLIDLHGVTHHPVEQLSRGKQRLAQPPELDPETIREPRRRSRSGSRSPASSMPNRW